MSIIDTIDKALDDYAVSDDAMRWTPEPTPAPDIRVRVRDPDLEWYEIRTGADVEDFLELVRLRQVQPIYPE